MAVFIGFLLLLFASNTTGSALFDLKRAPDQEKEPCVEAFDAAVEWMELLSGLNSIYTNDEIFKLLGFSLDRKQELKNVICKISGITTVRELANLTPLRNYSEVANIYSKFIRGNRKHIEGHANFLMLQYHINRLGHELGISVPRDFSSVETNHIIFLLGDRETMLTFFSTLAREFGPSFSTYLDGGSEWIKDVPEMVDIFQANAYNLNGAAVALGIPPTQLMHFIINILYMATRHPNHGEVYRRNGVYFRKLEAIGFWNLES